MSDQSERIVKKLWSDCQVLRDDGLIYQDYLEQLTSLLFLKMADERAALTGEAQPIPKGHRWDACRRESSTPRASKANVLFFDCRPGAREPWTKKVWFYDLRTNKDFTLKTRRMARADLDEFVACYNPKKRNQRKATWDEQEHPDGRWRAFSHDEIVARDECSLDIFWLKDESLEDSANLPEPHVLAKEIADDLRSALEQIESVLADLQQRARGRDA